MCAELDADETVIEKDGFELIRTADGRGAVKQAETDSDEPTVVEYQDYATARLAFGLQLRTDPYEWCGRDECVPIAVSNAGTDAVAAFLLTRDPDDTPSQADVANKIGVGVLTVRNYAHRVRWLPEKTPA